jgi:hypothetical protein
MKGKKFHMTAKGPEVCKTGPFGSCDFGAHYGSAEAARSQDEIQKATIAHLAEAKRLHDNHRNPHQGSFHRSAFTFDLKGTASPRKFGQEMDGIVKVRGVRPQVFHSMGQFRMNNGNGKEVNVVVYRKTKVDEGALRYEGDWLLTVKENKVGLHRHAKTVREEALDFRSLKSTKASMQKAYEVFRKAAISSGIYDEDKASRRTADMMAQFRDMVDAVESDACDSYLVYERGLGYFTKSDFETITADVDYRTSALRLDSVERFLTQSPSYFSYLPDVRLRVRDAHTNTGASWTLIREGGQWSVEKSYEDGRIETVQVTTPQEALDQVYYHHLGHVQPHHMYEEEALERGRFAYDLVEGTEAALERQRPVIQDWWERQAEQQAEGKAARKAGIPLEDYQRGVRPRPSARDLLQSVAKAFTRD